MFETAMKYETTSTSKAKTMKITTMVMCPLWEVSQMFDLFLSICFLTASVGPLAKQLGHASR